VKQQMKLDLGQIEFWIKNKPKTEDPFMMLKHHKWVLSLGFIFDPKLTSGSFHFLFLFLAIQATCSDEIAVGVTLSAVDTDELILCIPRQ